MNNEIKEITKVDKQLLNKIEHILASELSCKEYDVFYNYFNEIRKPNILIDIKDDENIKDYITNLQEELKSIKENYKIQLEYDKQLEREIEIKDAWANEIRLNLWDYDGCENSIPGLRGLVDEAIDKSEKIMSCDDKSIVWSGYAHDEHGNKYVEHKNVLGEVLTKFTEEDQKFIDSEEYKRFWFGGEDSE